jgi:hypothetical protein
LEEVFNNKHDVDEAKKRLFAFKQGNRTIEEFNALFNSLAYSVDLTEESHCDVYEQALNPNVLKIAVLRSDWKQATKLKEKQILAIAAAEAQDKISSIDSGTLPTIHRQPAQFRPNPPQTPAPVRIPGGVVPMDLDIISSDNTFSFPKFRALCVQHGICQQCGQKFDEDHKQVRGCVLPNDKHIDIKRKLELFRQWSVTRNQSVSQINTNISNLNHPPPSSQDNPLISNSILSTSKPLTSSAPSQVPLDQIPPLTMADYCLDQAIDEMEIESNIYCTSSDQFLSIPFKSSRPIMTASLSQSGHTRVEASVLLDSGASASFIDIDFACRNNLQLSPLRQVAFSRAGMGISDSQQR